MLTLHLFSDPLYRSWCGGTGARKEGQDSTFYLDCWFSNDIVECCNILAMDLNFSRKEKFSCLVPFFKRTIFLVLQVLFSDISAYEVSQIYLKITCSFQQLFFGICIVVHDFPFQTSSYHSVLSLMKLHGQNWNLTIEIRNWHKVGEKKLIETTGFRTKKHTHIRLDPNTRHPPRPTFKTQLKRIKLPFRVNVLKG